MLTQRDKDIMIHLEKYNAISINQAYRMFFNNTRYGYDIARKRLKQLEEMQLLSSYINQTTNEKVYYLDHKISAHDLYILDFYSLLHLYKCKNIEFTKEPRYLKDVIRPDGFFSFEFDGNLYFILLEIDLTHITSLSKFQTYERLYRNGDLQKVCYNTFPLIVVAGFDNNLKYESENFEVVYTDFKFTNFESKVLGIA